MALVPIWFDGADYYTSPSVSPYESINNNVISIGSGFARTGLNGIQFTTSAWLRKNLLGGNYNTLTAGAAVKVTNMGGGTASSVFGFADAGTTQCSIGIDSVGRMFVLNSVGGTILGPSATVIPANQFHYVEAQVTFGTGGAGVMSVYVDGALVLTGTGTNFSSANAYANQLYVGKIINGSSQFTVSIDDIYCASGTGAPLGDCAVVCQMPSASGAFAQWTPNPGAVNTNWQNVDDIPPDGATTFNATGATGNRDSFIYPSFPPAGLPNVGTIVAVMELEYGQSDAAGSCIIELALRQAGVDAFSTDIGLGVGYAYAFYIWYKDVNGNGWLASNLNATERGYKRVG